MKHRWRVSRWREAYWTQLLEEPDSVSLSLSVCVCVCVCVCVAVHFPERDIGLLLDCNISAIFHPQGHIRL